MLGAPTSGLCKMAWSAVTGEYRCTVVPGIPADGSFRSGLANGDVEL